MTTSRRRQLADRGIKAGGKELGGLTASEVIVAGEKVTVERDYYMEQTDFDRVVELYRHGPQVGSNYLYMDGHVAFALPELALRGINPWNSSVTGSPLLP